MKYLNPSVILLMILTAINVEKDPARAGDDAAPATQCAVETDREPASTSQKAATTQSAPTTQAAPGKRRLHKETIVEAPLAAVWHAWTTSEGIASFFSPDSNVHLRPGEPYELFMGMKEPDESGTRGSEGCKMLACIPKELLAFEWSFPPAIMSLRKAHEKTFVVIRMRQLPDKRVKVTLDQLGWRPGEDWDKGYAYFDSAWGHVMEWLRDKLPKAAAKFQLPSDAEGITKIWDDEGVLVKAYYGPGKRQDFEMMLNAPAERVWRLLSTTEGLRSLGGKDAKVDLKPWGAYAFWPEANNQVLAYLPMEVLAVTGSAPPEFPTVRKGGTWAAYFLQAKGKNKTYLRMALVGWREGEEWDKAYDYFLKNNPIWMRQVREALKDTDKKTSAREDPREKDRAFASAPSPAADADGPDATLYESYLAHIAAGDGALRDHDTAAARRWLDAAPREHRDWEWRYLDASADDSIGVWRGHEGVVMSVAISPDGGSLASGGMDETVRVWDIKTGNEVRVLRGHEGAVYGVTFSPDGAFLASSSQDKTVRLWRADSGEEAQVLRDPESHAMGVAFSPDGKQLAGTILGRVRVWSVETGELVRTLEGHNPRPPVVSVAYTRDGKRLLSASWDNQIIVWDAATGEKLQTLGPGYDGKEYVAYRGVSLTPDGRFAAGACFDGTVRIYDTDSAEEKVVLRGHGKEALAVVYCPDGKQLASASQDQSIRLWDAEAGKEAGVLQGHTGAVRCICFNADGSRLYSGSADKSIRVWEIGPQARPQRWQAHEKGIWGLVFTPDGKRMVTASSDKTVRVWTSGSGKLLYTLEGHASDVASLAASPDGRHAVSGGNDATARVWDLDAGKETATFSGHKGGIPGVAYSPDGNRIATGSYDKTARIWDAATHKELAILGPFAASAYRVAFSPDGTRIAVGVSDGTTHVFQAKASAAPVEAKLLTAVDSDSSARLETSHPSKADSFEELHVFRGQQSPIYALAFSADGSILAAGSADGTIRLWNASGEPIRALTGHEDYVWELSFHPDGTRLASASYDQTARIWDVSTGQCVLTLRAPEKAYTVCFSPDGRQLAWTTIDGVVRMATTAS